MVLKSRIPTFVLTNRTIVINFFAYPKLTITSVLLAIQITLCGQGAIVPPSFGKVTADDIYYRGTRALRNDNLEIAMTYFNRALRMESDMAKAINKRGEVYYRKKD